MPASPAADRRTGFLVLKGAALRVLSMTVNIVGTFFLLPFMIFHLGDYWYGVWALIGAVIVQYHILDFGISQTVVRFISKHRAERATPEATAIFSTALGAFSVFGLLSFIGVCFIAGHAGDWVENPAEGDLLALTILLAGATMCCAFPTYAVEGYYTGAMRQDVLSTLQIIRTVLRLSLTYYFMSEGYSIVALAAISLGCDSLYRIKIALLLRYFVAEAKFDWKSISFACLKSMFRFGRFVFLINIARYSVIHSSMIVTGWMVGVAAATTYAIAINIIDRLEGIVRMALFMTMPAFTGIATEQSQKRLLQDRYLMVSRLVTFGVTTICGGLIVAGQPFVAAWMGPEYLAAYWPLAILAAAWMADLSQVPAMLLLTAVGQHQRFSIFEAGIAASCLVLSIILASLYGLVGVALGVAIPVAFSALVLKPWFAAKALGLPRSRLYQEGGKVWLGCIAMQAPIWLLLQQQSELSLVELAIFGAITYGPTSIVGAAMLLPASDQRYILGLLPARVRAPAKRLLPYLRAPAGQS